MTQWLGELDADIESIQDETTKELAKARMEETMATYHGDDELISSFDIYERMKIEPDEEKFMTGIGGLDDLLNGFRKNQLIVLAAPTKSGKSQMTVELAIRMPDTKPVFLPFEESADELVRKFYDLKIAPPLFYTPRNITNNTLTWIEKRIVEGKVKYNSKLFFIDHLHFIVPMTSERLDTRIGQTMRDLKTIAKRHGVMIVLVSHLKKTNMLISPTLEDLRDSSFIAQEADTVLMMWREAKREGNEMIVTNNTMLSVQANRRTGSTGNVRMTFNSKTGRFLEFDWRDEDEGGENKW